MDSQTAHKYASNCFTILYSVQPSATETYFEYCKAIRTGTLPGDEHNGLHLEHLRLYECAQRGDFDYWLTSPDKISRMVQYAAMGGRCDIIERYVPQLPDDPLWNFYVSIFYKPSMYSVLALVMPLPATPSDAAQYVHRGLHREVAVHILGRAGHRTGEAITLESIALKPCIVYGSSLHLLDLEKLGLDLGNPQLLYAALSRHASRATIALLRERCVHAGKLSMVMPNGQTLREMLPA